MKENSMMTDHGASSSKDLQLDDIDRKILRELMADARLPNNTLAARLKVAPSTALLRVRRLIEARIIRGSHISVDLKAMGMTVQALIAVDLQPMARNQIRNFAARAARMPMVLSMFYLGGELDFLIHVACPSTEHLTELVTERLNADPVVASTRTYLIFEHYDEARIRRLAARPAAS